MNRILDRYWKFRESDLLCNIPFSDCSVGCDLQFNVNRSSFYYQPREDPSEAVLRAEIEKLAGQYPRYGYRRITQLLVRQGHTVGTRRVARLIKENNA